ncbi:MAG TPA: hypothetical protein VJM31_02310 [Vicinamibacterales bacterium]|nr:hypothetical protein [Vicinamibacterales bacterium]
MAFSIRLDEGTERAITRLAHLRRQTKAAIVREALAAYEAGAGAASGAQGPAVALAPFIGVADSRGSRRSENTGEGFLALLKRAGGPSGPGQRKTRVRRSR